MSIAGYNNKITTVMVPDPAADLVGLMLVAPLGGMTIHSVYFSCSAAIASHADNHITGSLLDGGADGTGSTSMASFGGASTAWLAANGYAGTITQAKIDEGDRLLFKYDEAGAVAPGDFTVAVEWSQGGDNP